MLIPNAKETVLVIPDTQLPFDHVDSIEFLRAVKEYIKPTKIVHIGDYFDLHALSQYDHDPDGFSAGDELKAALKRAEEYYKLFPKCHLIAGNHDVRVYKRALSVGIPSAFLKGYLEWMKAPQGWSVHDKLEIDSVLYIHGEGFSGSSAHLTAATKHMQSIVMGHLHSHAGIAYIASHKALCFGMNVGCLINTKSYAFAYGKTMPNKPILGCGVVKKGVPMLIPMLLNKNGRWVGKI
jgi:predicted phosphodiesterase